MNHDTDEHLASAVSAGVVQGFREVLEDHELMSQFWEQGFEKLTGHASDGASKWVGRRILIAAIAALFIWSMGWLMRNGAIK